MSAEMNEEHWQIVESMATKLIVEGMRSAGCDCDVVVHLHRDEGDVPALLAGVSHQESCRLFAMQRAWTN